PRSRSRSARTTASPRSTRWAPATRSAHTPRGAGSGLGLPSNAPTCCERGAEMTKGTVTADGRARVLADGNEIPLLGLGVWQIPDGPETEKAVRWALELGYRHVDTAQAYGNEASVGRALRDSIVPREDVFITTKFYPGSKDPEAEAERSL